MAEPTSDVGEDVDAEDAPHCVNCRGAIGSSPTRRVETWIEDGQVQYRHFCGESCLAEWRLSPGRH